MSIDFYVDLYTALGSDLSLDERDVAYIRNRIVNEGIGFCTKTLPAFGKALLAHLEHVGAGDGLDRSCPFQFPTFKQSGLRHRPYFLARFYDRVFCKDSDPSALAVILQVCMLAYKVEYPFTDAQKAKVEESFIADDDDTARHVPDPWVKAQLTGIIHRLHNARPIQDWLYPVKDGPGVCAEATDAKLEKLYRLPSLVHVGACAFNANHVDELCSRVQPNTSNSYFTTNLPSKGIFVPKDSRGPRFIAAEPSQNMRLQQAIAATLSADLVAKSGGRINFTDQTVNGQLALWASGNKAFSTLDLQAASDRVPLWAVDLFSTELRYAMLTTRSSYMRLPSGRLRKLSKFAPMGSALCFPVLSSFTYAVSVLYLHVTFGIEIERAMGLVFVFGDDLIVPSCVDVDHFSRWLLRYSNLKVNVAKSYRNSAFRESCGIEAYAGSEVTPIRLRNYPDNAKKESCVSILATANHFAECGLTRSASFLFRSVELILGKLPCSDDKAPYLGKCFDHIVDGMACMLTKHARVRSYSLKSDRIRVNETMYDYLVRTRNTHVENRPDFGVREKPKTARLVARWFPKWNGFTPSKWLPT